MRGVYICLIVLLGLSACKIQFTLKGSSVPDNLNTFTVQYYENRAPLINPTLSQDFTEGLKDRVTRESRLVLEDRNGDIDFSGQITGYDIKAMAIEADAESAETRLTISLKVRYRNFKDPKDNWESTFSAYQDFSSDSDIDEVEEELVDLIVDQITEDIFNKAFSDW